MLYLLEQLARSITTTEVWSGVLFSLLLGFGLGLLGYGWGFTINFPGPLPWLKWDRNDTRPWRERIVLSLIGLGLFVPGLIGFVRLTSMTTLKVLTSLSEEEYARFQDLEDMFHKKYEGEKLRIRSENVNWPDLIRRLKQERIDVIVFDVTRRLDLLHEGLLRPLDHHNLFIPASVYPTLLANVNFNKRLYFLPYRPNVRIGWWNSHHPAAVAYKKEFEASQPSFNIGGPCKDEPRELPKRWQDVWKVVTSQPSFNIGGPCKDEPTGLPKRWQDVRKVAALQPPLNIGSPSEARLEQYGVVLS